MRNILPILIITLLTLVGFVIAEEATGPTPAGGQVNAKHGPVQMGAYAQPSALPSPVAAGKVDRITTDGEGNLWTRLRSGAVSVSSGNVAVTNITTGNVAVVGISDSGGTTLSDSIGLIVQGTRDHDSAVTSTHNPFVGGAIAYDTLPAGVSTDADVCRVSSTKQGQLRVILDANANAVGASLFRTVALTNVSQQIKSSGGNVYSIILGNPGTVCWAHVYDTANASVTVGTTTPVASYMVPANTTIVIPGPVTHSTAICIAATNSVSDDEMTATNLTATVHYK